MKLFIGIIVFLILGAGLPPASAQIRPIDEGEHPSIESWWTVFDDPLLDSLENLGLQRNLDLQIMLARVEEARARIRLAQSHQYPSIQLNPYFASQSLSPNRPTTTAMEEGRELQRFSLQTYQVPLDLSYELDLWQRIKRQVKGETHLKEATEAEMQAVALSLSSEIARFYFLLRTVDAEQAVVQRGISLRDSTLKIAEARYAAGLVSHMDVQRAETEVANAMVQLEELNRSRKEMELSLAVLLGINPADISIEKGQLPLMLPRIPVPAEAELALNRPDLRQAERMLASTNSQVAVQKAARLPRLHLLGSAGFLSREVSQVFSSTSGTYLLGASISLPLFEGFRNQSQIAIAQRQVEMAESGFQQHYLTALREVKSAVDNLEVLSRQVQVQQQALQSAQTTRLYARELYIKGLTSFLEAIDAERTALELERQAVNLKGQQVLYTLALIKASGGKIRN